MCDHPNFKYNPECVNCSVCNKKAFLSFCKICNKVNNPGAWCENCNRWRYLSEPIIELDSCEDKEQNKIAENIE